MKWLSPMIMVFCVIFVVAYDIFDYQNQTKLAHDAYVAGYAEGLNNAIIRKMKVCGSI